MFSRFLCGSMAEFRSLERSFFGRKTSNKVPVCIVCDSTGLACEDTVRTPTTSIEGTTYEEVPIGNIVLTDKTSWDELDYFVEKSFKKFVTTTWPYWKLGLTKQSISVYEFGGSMLRSPDDPSLPETFPFEHLVNNSSPIRIYLKGAVQRASTDALSFHTQVSKEAIGVHLQRLLEKGRIVFVGPQDYTLERMESTTINFVARRFAEYLAAFHNVPLNSAPNTITTFTCTKSPDRVNKLRLFIDDMMIRCKYARRDVNNERARLRPIPYVIIIENLHDICNDIIEIVKGFAIFKKATKEVPFIIGTFTHSPESKVKPQFKNKAGKSGKDNEVKRPLRPGVAESLV